MSVVWSKSQRDQVESIRDSGSSYLANTIGLDRATGLNCYVCGDPLPKPFVWWRCNPSDLFLCPQCAAHMARGILLDVDRIETSDTGETR